MKYKLLFLIFFSSNLFAQTFISEIENNDFNSQNTIQENFFVEKSEIIKVSRSKKIIVISNNNNNNKVTQGDFITILLDKKPIARALVAKIKENKAGIKIIRIHSGELWNNIKPKVKIEILRGDSTLPRRKETFTKKNENSEEKDLEALKNQDSIVLSEEVAFPDKIVYENNKRFIKNDNILSFQFNNIEGIGINGSSVRYGQIGMSWSYQVINNSWVEMLGSINTIKDFPAVSLDTRYMNFIGRVKYLFRLPFFFYAMPYVGYQITIPQSPGAGVPSAQTSPEDLRQEVYLVDQLEKRKFIFGVSIIKRLVPGWLAHADVGSDILSLGLALEF